YSGGQPSAWAFIVAWPATAKSSRIVMFECIDFWPFKKATAGPGVNNFSTIFLNLLQSNPPRPNRLLLEAAAAITQPARTIIWPRGHLDIVNRRRRMKRHQLKKFRKRCAAMLRDKRLLREKKKEAEFQEQLHHMKLRTFGSDPVQKIEQQLKLARRSGYHADLLAKIDVKPGGNIKPKF
ncbi:hypothetical protein BOX15_Mlig004524g1, partial [Macrostomum lignano]